MLRIPKRDAERAVRVSKQYQKKYASLLDEVVATRLRSAKAQYKADTATTMQRLAALKKERVNLSKLIEGANKRIDDLYAKADKIQGTIDAGLAEIEEIKQKEFDLANTYKTVWAKNPNDTGYEEWLRENVKVLNGSNYFTDNQAVSYTANYPTDENTQWVDPLTVVIQKRPSTDGAYWSRELIDICKAAKAYRDADDSSMEAYDTLTLFYKTIKAEFPQLVNTAIPVELTYT